MHYPSDLRAGALLGAASAWVWLAAAARLASPRPDRPRRASHPNCAAVRQGAATSHQVCT